MDSLTISNFKFGLDTRRSELTSVPGTLETCENAHIDPGGQVEKRKAFVLNGDLGILDDDSGGGGPFTGTFGLEVTSAGLVTFGSALLNGATVTQSQPRLASAIPAGFTYQQLKHPALTDDATLAYARAIHRMTQLVFSCNYLGSAVALAKFADGKTFLYYNGTIVSHSRNGIVLTGRTSLANLGSDLARQLGELSGWSATANQNELGTTVNGEDVAKSPSGNYYGTPASSNNSTSGLQSYTFNSKDGNGTAGISAVAKFAITTNGTITMTAPKNSDGTGTSDLVGGTVAAGGSIAATCTAVTNAVNANTLFTGYFAVTDGQANIFVYAQVSWGAVTFNLTVAGTAVTAASAVNAAIVVKVSPISLTIDAGVGAFGSDVYNPSRPTCSATGGQVSYTYAWREVNQDGTAVTNSSGLYATSPTAATTGFKESLSQPGGVSNSRTGYFICKVTDSAATPNVKDSPVVSVKYNY